MDAEALKELFEPFGAVAVKRMFGGHGVYAHDLCFAVESGGEVFLKADADSQPSFAAAGSSPYVYMAKGKPMTTSYWRLPANAHDDADELRRGRRSASTPPVARLRKRAGRRRRRGAGNSVVGPEIP